MFDPSDSRQRSTLVDLAWLLIGLYFLYSITGFRNFGCERMPRGKFNEGQEEKIAPVNERNVDPR